MKTKNKSLLGLCCFLLVTFTACEAKEPPVNTGLVESSTEYHITKIPISPRPYQWIWCDDNHLAGSIGPAEKKIIYLDVTKPTAPLMIDLSSLGTPQSNAVLLSCRGEEIAFLITTPASPPLYNLKLYRMKPQQTPELVLGMEDNRFAIAAFHSEAKYIVLRGELSKNGVYAGPKECKVKYIKQGYRSFCWDSHGKKYWPLSKFVFSENGWSSKIWLMGKDGKPVFTENPKPPFRDKDGKIVYGWYELHDINSGSVINLYSSVYLTQISLQFDPDELYAYLPSRRRSEKVFLRRANVSKTLVDRICRYRLDGSKHEWEEVFVLEQRGHKYLPDHAGKLNISRVGDVIYEDPRFPGTSLYITKAKTSKQLFQGEIFWHGISPDGRYIASNPKNDPSNLYLIQRRMEEKSQ